MAKGGRKGHHAISKIQIETCSWQRCNGCNHRYYRYHYCGRWFVCCYSSQFFYDYKLRGHYTVFYFNFIREYDEHEYYELLGFDSSVNINYIVLFFVFSDYFDDILIVKYIDYITIPPDPYDRQLGLAD